MMNHTCMAVLTAVLLMAGCATNPPMSESGRDLNRLAYQEITPDPELPDVLLIGDSISIGYTDPVRTRLQGEANVYRIPMNAGPTSRGLEHIREWLGDTEWDVIHFNWGLHDLKYMDDGFHQVAIPAYRQNLVTLVRILQSTGATLIWASTTPVPSDRVSPPRRPMDVVRYNEAAATIMKRYGVAINDLYAFILPHLDTLQQPHNVHFHPPGSRELGRKVAREIRNALQNPR